jgi:hypothetical protein
MAPTLSERIVACLLGLAKRIEAWAEAHPDAPLAEQEWAVLGLVRAALPALLEAVLLACTPGLSEPGLSARQPCPGCGKGRRPLGRRGRTVLTVCGAVTFARAYYYCRECRRGWAPADGGLGLAPRQRLSERVRGWVAWLAAATVFREAETWLDELTGLELGAETIRSHAGAAGAELAAARAAAAAAVGKTREAAEAVDAAPGQLVVETDGVMVHYLDGWHEVKVGLVGGWDGERTVAQSYLASRSAAEAFGPLLLAEAARRGALDVVGRVGAVTRRGLYLLRSVVVLGDGAVWIWNLAADHFGERVEIVDFYHAAEHLWEVANAVYGAGSEAARAWAKARIHDLRDEGAAPVRKALAALLPRRGAAEDADPAPEAAEAAPEPDDQAPPPALGEPARELVRRELGYFRTNAARMDYPGFRALGLPIGSGAVESAGKYAVQLRMKRPGSRWSDGGGEAILAVRERSLSGRPILLNASDPAPPALKPTERAA